MSDKIKKILALLFCVGNGLMGGMMMLAALFSMDSDSPAMLAIGAIFLLNGFLMWMYAQSLKQNIRYKEILDEEERSRRLKKEIYEEDDLSDLLTGRSQYAEKETFRR